jgi:hypothetical protein
MLILGTYRCRLHDLTPPTNTQSNRSSYYGANTSPPLSPSAYSRGFPSALSTTNTPSHEEGPDIIPRFSPTISRPRSYFNSDPYPSAHSVSYQPSPTVPSSPPSRHYNSQSSTALASLRELADALPKSKSKSKGKRKDKKDSDSDSEERSTQRMSRTGSGVWNYIPSIPFTSSSRNTTPSITPAGSYTAPPASNAQYTVSSSSYGPVSYAGGYGNASGRSREDLYSYGKSHGAVNYNTMGGMDRPLPPRGGPGGYGHRPKSVDLVTPFGNVQ